MKKIILLIFIFSYSFSYSQFNWKRGSLILKNGDTLEGYVRIPRKTSGLLAIDRTKVQYKKDKKGKKKKFKKEEIDKVYFVSFNSSIGYYEYVPTGLFKRKTLLKLIKKGKVKLYIRTVLAGVETGFGDSKRKTPKNIKEYFIIRKTETVATQVFLNSKSSLFYESHVKTFNNFARKYFSDCEKVVSYIEDDLYKNFDINQIVEDYNLLCD